LFAAPVGAVSVPNTFQAGQTASAAEVNANFDALVQAVDDLQAQLDAQSAAISALQQDLTAAETEIDAQSTTIAGLEQDLAAAELEITALQSNSVLALDGLLTLEVDANGYDTARFDQVNVQITNGMGATNGNPTSGSPTDVGMVNGLGNLIVGYNETSDRQPFCSDPVHNFQFDCENSGGVWGANQRSGSHNLVIGVGHGYTSHGGLIAGFENAVNGAWGSASGGGGHLASGKGSSVSGGLVNTASGKQSSVSGGFGNSANGSWSSVSGGESNTASGSESSVSGGAENTASGKRSSVSGGESNTASGSESSVSGGESNTASGRRSSVSGGFGNSANGSWSSVSGGWGRVANVALCTVGDDGVNC
jgi:hypothetical protein